MWYCCINLIFLLLLTGVWVGEVGRVASASYIRLSRTSSQPSTSLSSIRLVRILSLYSLVHSICTTLYILHLSLVLFCFHLWLSLVTSRYITRYLLVHSVTTQYSVSVTLLILRYYSVTSNLRYYSVIYSLYYFPLFNNKVSLNYVILSLFCVLT